MSKKLRISFLTTWVTSVPKECKIPANSTPIYPPPYTTTFLGYSSQSKNLSESSQCSIPSILGSIKGYDPVAIHIWSAVYLWSPT